jgi:hypothetical protein
VTLAGCDLFTPSVGAVFVVTLAGGQNRLDGSGAEDPHEPAVRRLMAETFAELVHRGEPRR